MPYYLTPSFPYEVNAPALKPALEQLRIRPRPAEKRSEPPVAGNLDLPSLSAPIKFPRLAKEIRRVDPRVNENEVLAAWLNGQLLGLDPVFPNRPMFDLAADLYFRTDEGPSELTTDLMSIDILPFGRDRDMGLNDLLSLRKNEGTFEEVRNAVVACKEFLETEFDFESTQGGMSVACRGFLRERLDDCERRSVLRFVEDHPVAGVAVSVAVGAALIPVAPAISVFAGALATPQLALWARRRLDPKRRAIGRLQALL
jgi:hypothetical protein